MPLAQSRPLPASAPSAKIERAPTIVEALAERNFGACCFKLRCLKTLPAHFSYPVTYVEADSRGVVDAKVLAEIAERIATVARANEDSATRTETMETPTIDADRYSLRKLMRCDASALFSTLSNETQCLYWSHPAFEREDDLADWLTDPDWNGRSWVGVDKSDGGIVGRFVVVPAHEQGISELGYMTVAQRQGQGVARTCMRALISYLFGREAHRRLYAEIDADNIASIALIEGLGFTREGRLREHEMTHKGICDMLIYGLLKREW